MPFDPVPSGRGYWSADKLKVGQPVVNYSLTQIDMGEVKPEVQPTRHYKRSAAQRKAMAFKVKVNALRKMIRNREVFAEHLVKGAKNLKKYDKTILKAKKALIRSI